MDVSFINDIWRQISCYSYTGCSKINEHISQNQSIAEDYLTSLQYSMYLSNRQKTVLYSRLFILILKGMEKSERRGAYLYVMARTGGIYPDCIKVGISKNPQERLRQVRKSSGIHDLSLWYEIKGAWVLESTLHSVLAVSNMNRSRITIPGIRFGNEFFLWSRESGWCPVCVFMACMVQVFGNPLVR